ncbi:superoxide dismutase [Cu-Zn]-like [Ptychodera flava]|uniref:superoxide dismutase [Cu-Zn]-like n=1 Tax=Ptychodera flava TaxID=63121 RepID=UPI003969CA01
MATASLLSAVIVCLVCAATASDCDTRYASCIVMPNKNYEGPQVTGEIKFSQKFGYQRIEEVVVEVEMSGFDPSTKLHGFHIHQYGDLSNGCQSTGGHYNPFNKNHGAPTDVERHVGDLGNVAVDSAGKVSTVIKDSQITLGGKYSILGRAVVVHEGVDDLGRTGGTGSMTTGNAGPRMACCVIGISPAP